jgi:hypothetical protein
MCKMNCVCIKIMLKVESLKTELLKVSAPVPCGVVCVGVCLVTDSKNVKSGNAWYITKRATVGYCRATLVFKSSGISSTKCNRITTLCLEVDIIELYLCWNLRLLILISLLVFIVYIYGHKHRIFAEGTFLHLSLKLRIFFLHGKQFN